MSETVEDGEFRANERCKDCRFWSPDSQKPEFLDADDWIGRCHRHAPTPSVEEGQRDSNVVWWPCTAHYDWCGEFQTRQ